MILFKSFVTYFDNKIFTFEYFIKNKRPKVLFRFIIYPIVFVSLLFFSFFHVIINSLFWGKKSDVTFLKNDLKNISEETKVDEEFVNNINIKESQTHSIFHKDTTTKYLYDAELKEVDLEEKERKAKQYLEKARKEQYLETRNRELSAGYEGIEGNMFAMLTTEIPKCETALNKKMKERIENEKNAEKTDIEELRQKLLNPNGSGGGTSKQLQMEPFKGK